MHLISTSSNSFRVYMDTSLGTWKPFWRVVCWTTSPSTFCDNSLSLFAQGKPKSYQSLAPGKWLRGPFKIGKTGLLYKTFPGLLSPVGNHMPAILDIPRSFPQKQPRQQQNGTDDRRLYHYQLPTAHLRIFTFHHLRQQYRIPLLVLPMTFL